MAKSTQMIVAAIQQCVHDASCLGCPYRGMSCCKDSLMLDAAAAIVAADGKRTDG